MLPAGYKTPENRVKPWGTGHAVWCARHQINEPFAVINADDFYGKEAYEVLAQAMQETTPNQHYMVAYKLKNTVSPYGSVSRGVCTTNDADELKVVVEHTKIVKKPEGIFFDNHGTERSSIRNFP